MSERKKLDTNRLKKSRGLGSPPSLGTGGNRIKTDFQIDWNRSTIIFYAAVIIVPYLTAVIGTALTGYIFITGILIFVGLLVGVLYWIIRKIDESGGF